MKEQAHIGHYILGKTIGNGGFAKVKQARHDLTGARVAVKILNKRKMKNKNMQKKVNKQIKILKFIDHPNIVKLYEVFSSTNDILVVMQLAQGGQLYEYIQNNQITQGQAKFFFKQIISGVDYAHKNLVTHRDLKPQNILLDKNKVIKIIDFGLSNYMRNGKLLKTPCGSPNYAAPQIVGQRKYQGTTVDIWSCGVILYILLVGNFPFESENVSALYRKIQQGAYTIPNTVSPTAANLISRMLQVDPYKRIKINQIMNHPWLRNYIPLYVKIPINYTIEKEDQIHIDEEIFSVVKQKIPKIAKLNQQKVKRSIKKRDQQSFVITYQLLRDQKQKLLNTQNLLNRINEIPKSMIFNQVENIIIKKQYKKESSFQYGKRISRSIKLLAQNILNSFKILGITYQIKSIDYCMRCQYILQQTNKKNQDQQMVEQMQQVQKQDRFTKKYIVFLLQIYCVDPRSTDHVIDVQLNQGHPIVFFNIIHKLFKTIDQSKSGY